MPTDPEILVQLLLQPHEEVDREYKNWLNILDDDDRAKIAKELLALANHGGGYLIFGFEDGTSQEASGRPSNLDAFTSDEVNKIVARFADPSFECLLYRVMHPTLQREFPIVCVPGGNRVPIRCKSGHKSNIVEQNRYYTRLPGPESSTPRTAKDWDDLIKRCVLNSKNDLLNSIRIIMTGQLLDSESRESINELLDSWISDCDSQWIPTAKTIALQEDRDRFALGYWTVAYTLGGFKETVDIDELCRLMKASPGTNIYPAWNVAAQQNVHPSFDTDETVVWQQFRANDNWPSSWSTYARVRNDLSFFLRAGFVEDVGEGITRPKPGDVFYSSNPVEFILRTVEHAAHICKELNRNDLKIMLKIVWNHTKGRKLRASYGSYESQILGGFASDPTEREEITAYIGEVPMAELQSNFPEGALKTVQSVFRAFGYTPDQGHLKRYIAGFK